MLQELQKITAAPPPGAPPVDTHALAAQATAKTQTLLAEAIELQSQHREREAIERLLTAYDMEMPPLAKAQLHNLAGNGFARLSELEQAEGHYRWALEAAREAGHQQGQAAALGNLGIVYSQRGDLPRAEEHHQKALAIDEEIGDRLGQANSLGNLGLVAERRGDLDAAEEHHQKALAIQEEIGDYLGQANQLGNLGNVYRGRGELERAEEHYQKALSLFQQIGAQPEIEQTERLIRELRTPPQE